MQTLELNFRNYVETNYKPFNLETGIILDSIQSVDNKDTITTNNYSFCNYLQNNLTNCNYSTLINKHINRLDKKPTHVQIDSNILPSTFSRMINNFDAKSSYSPTKKNLIKICVGLELNYEGAMELLKTCGYCFSNSSKFDLACEYFFKEYRYSSRDRGTGKAIGYLEENLVMNNYGDLMEGSR